MKILIFTSKLHMGGAEMHLCNLVNELSNSEIEITILVSQKFGSYEKILNKEIRIIYPYFNFKSYTLSLFAALLKLINVTKKLKPDLVFSIQDGPNVINLLSGYMNRDVKRIICVQNNPLTLKNSFVGRFILFLTKKLYPKSDFLISLSKGVKNHYTSFVEKFPNFAIIPNIGNLNYGLADQKPKKLNLNKKLKFLAVGRLEEQKDYPTLFYALSELSNNLDFELNILGTGSKLKELKKLRSDLNLETKINFKGFTENTSKYYCESDIFMISSKWEGFGNVIVEAMSYGLPVISTDCEYGPNEIITDFKDGLLVEVENYKKFANSIQHVIRDNKTYNGMSKNAIEKSKKYMSKIIANKYKSVFENV